MSVSQKRKRGISVTLIEKIVQCKNLNYVKPQPYIGKCEFPSHPQKIYIQQAQQKPTLKSDLLKQAPLCQNQSQILDNNIRQLQLEIVRARTRLSQINYVNTKRKASEIRSNMSGNLSLSDIKSRDQQKSLLIQSRVNNKLKVFAPVKQQQIQKASSNIKNKQQKYSKQTPQQQKSAKKIPQFRQKQTPRTVQKKNSSKNKQNSISNQLNRSECCPQNYKVRAKDNKNHSVSHMKKIKPNDQFNFFNNQILSKVFKSKQKPQKLNKIKNKTTNVTNITNIKKARPNSSKLM